MKIGLWNIDHPETGSGASKKERRFEEVREYLIRAACDAYILTEANAGLVLPGHFSTFSAESPFRSRSRFYGKPNCYHQVAIYSATPLEPLEIAEPVNGLLCKISGPGRLQRLYGNVITIKDRWSHTSSKNYQDRLNEQIAAICGLPEEGCLVGGDFNTRLGWQQMQSAYRQVDELTASRGWPWPTKMRRDTVQHVLHSSDLRTDILVDLSVKEAQADRPVLSDHPFVSVTLIDG